MSSYVSVPNNIKKDYSNTQMTNIKVLGYLGKGMWECQCKCGKIVKVYTTNLNRYPDRCCNRCSKKTHGLSRDTTGKHTITFRSYLAMKQRCLNLNSTGYERYGGRGISIDDSWINSFENFYKDLGERPSPEHSLERKDVDGDYTKSNCFWATNREQSRNKRSTLIVTFNEETKPLIEFCEELGFNYETIYKRITRSGWGIEKALSTPLRIRKSK